MRLLVQTYWPCLLLWIGISVSVAQNLSLLCPEEWMKLYERCYLPATFPRSWLESSNYCRKYGAHLAKPTGFTISGILAAEMTSRNVTRFWTENIEAVVAMRNPVMYKFD